MSRKLDAAIAEALGYKIKSAPRRSRYSDDLVMFVRGKWRRLPEYSKRGNYMLELDREMRDRGFTVSVYRDKNLKYWGGEHKAVYYDNDTNVELDLDTDLYNVAYADTEPLARALAAYKALTGKEWSEE